MPTTATWRSTWTRFVLVQRLRLYLRVPLQVSPVAVAAHHGHVGDVEATFEHGRNPLVPQVVKVQVGDAEDLARSLREAAKRAHSVIIKATGSEP